MVFILGILISINYIASQNSIVNHKFNNLRTTSTIFLLHPRLFATACVPPPRGDPSEFQPKSRKLPP